MMQEIYTLALQVFGSILGGFIGIYIAKKLLFSPDNIAETIEIALEYVTKTEDGQKKAFLLGGLIGNGLKTAIGINTRGGGKFKFEDFLIQMGMQWAGKALTGQQQPQQTQTPWET